MALLCGFECECGYRFDRQLEAIVCPELSDREKKEVAELDGKIEEKQGELNEVNRLLGAP